jgi:hypothetical protein
MHALNLSASVLRWVLQASFTSAPKLGEIDRHAMHGPCSMGIDRHAMQHGYNALSERNPYPDSGDSYRTCSRAGPTLLLADTHAVNLKAAEC